MTKSALIIRLLGANNPVTNNPLEALIRDAVVKVRDDERGAYAAREAVIVLLHDIASIAARFDEVRGLPFDAEPEPPQLTRMSVEVFTLAGDDANGTHGEAFATEREAYLALFDKFADQDAPEELAHLIASYDSADGELWDLITEYKDSDLDTYQVEGGKITLPWPSPALAPMESRVADALRRAGQAATFEYPCAIHLSREDGRWWQIGREESPKWCGQLQDQDGRVHAAIRASADSTSEDPESIAASLIIAISLAKDDDGKPV